MNEPYYTVTVSNIGYVCNDVSWEEAQDTYEYYVRESISGVGKASNERVSLWSSTADDPIAEHDAVDYNLALLQDNTVPLARRLAALDWLEAQNQINLGWLESLRKEWTP